MLRTDGGILLLRAFECGDGDLAGSFIEDGHVDAVVVAPQSEQYETAGGEFDRDRAPALLADNRTGPRAVTFHLPAFDRVDKCGHGYPNSFATFWNHATSAVGM